MIEGELSQWRGVTWTFEIGGRHKRVVVQCGDKRRFSTYTETRTDRRGMLNNICHLRRLCREIGAERA